MKLNIKERLLLLNVLPKEGNILTLRVVRDLQNKISFSSDELEKAQLKFSSDGVSWDDKYTEEKEVELSQSEFQIIKDEFDKLDKSNKFLIDMIDIYDKIKGGN